MDIIRRNTDYALRLIVHLAAHSDTGAISSRVLSKEEDVSYHLTCKLLQRLSEAGFVRSTRGVNGGFSLRIPPSEIRLLDVIESIQGPLVFNRCLLSKDACPRQGSCPITGKLRGLQDHLAESLNGITVADLAETAV